MTGRPRQRRLPAQPLVDLIMREAGPTVHDNLDTLVAPSRVVADLLGIHPRSVRRYLADGIPVTTADRFAAIVGVHPTYVWGDLFFVGMGAVS